MPGFIATTGYYHRDTNERITTTEQRVIADNRPAALADAMRQALPDDEWWNARSDGEPPPDPCVEHDVRGVREWIATAPPPADGRWATCGTCGRTWDDEHVTGCTPAPAGRCPFEYAHADDDD